MKTKNLLFWFMTAMLITGLTGCDNQEDDSGFFLDDPAQTFERGFEEDLSFTEGEDIEGNIPSASSGFSLWHRLPTGQKSCYDNLTEISCPLEGERYYGQDGQHSIGVRSFTDNGNETVTDDDTGFTWQKGFKAGVTWYEAESYCKNLTLNALLWRLPTPHELRSLVDYNTYDPAIDAAAFPDTPSDWFWASKHSYFNDVTAKQEASWMINFFDGFVEYTARYNLYNVRCIKVD
jgi:hypothetical protein